MAAFRFNTTLIDKQKTALDKIEKQSKSWILFFIISSTCFLLVSVLGYFFNTDIIEEKSIYFLLSIISVCLFWWFWTINFIFQAVKNQKIIFNILTDIENDIKNIKNNIANIDNP